MAVRCRRTFAAASSLLAQLAGLPDRAVGLDLAPMHVSALLRTAPSPPLRLLPPAALLSKTLPHCALQTRFGEDVAVVGSFSGWDPAEPLKLEWSEGSVWQGELEVPAG